MSIQNKFGKITQPVLIIDDDEITRKVLRIYLTKNDLHVIEAKNGKEGLQHWKRKKPFFILMDVKLPDYNGYQLTKEIRNQELTLGTHTPIIAITAYAMHGDKEKCIQAGMDQYLAKPFNLTQLSDILKPFLNETGKTINSPH